MDICPIMPSVFIPDELIAEILSSLSVKTLVQCKCVSKLWNTLISDSTFFNKHLKKSSQKQHLIVSWREYSRGSVFVPFPLYRLHENPSITACKDDLHCLSDRYSIAGTCNGLICLYTSDVYFGARGLYNVYSVYLWNPSTGKKPEKFASFNKYGDIKFAFGYDDSTKTYKVVAFNIEASAKSVVKVFSLGDNGWRNIQCFPVVPLNWADHDKTCFNNGVHLSGTINWLAIYNYFDSSYHSNNITNVEQFVIISLDLSTETYKVLLLPQGFVEVPNVRPVVNVLMECLCFSHQEKDTFVVWQMKEYGIQECWTQLFKIRYQSLPKDFFNECIQMACLYKNGNMAIFAKKCGRHVLIYNLRDKKVERVTVTKEMFFHANLYIESLVAVC